MNYIESSYITSSVYYDGSIYHYEYRADSKIDNRDISNITIDLCNSTEICNIYGDDPFKFVNEKDYIKFDNIKPKGSDFVFGFYSTYAPEINESYIKASNKVYKTGVFSPSCQIPEPSVLSLLFGFIFLLTKRRR